MSNHGLQVGSIDVASAGPITFGPDAILFIADSAAAKLFAVDVDDRGPAGAEPFDVENLDARVASFLGCAPDDVFIRDMAVHPVSNNVYLSIQRGFGDAAKAVFVRVDRLDGTISEVQLDGVPMAEASIADAPAVDDERQTGILDSPEGEEKTYHGITIRILRQPIRAATITDMAYFDGAVFVAGLSNEEFSSKLRRIPFPFDGGVKASNLEIFHVSHGKWETEAPIRTFVPYDSGRSILASYTCTPLVVFPVDELVPGTKAVGRTVAELGPVNQPLDMVTYLQDGEEYLLVANSSHGLLKIACRDIDNQEALTEPHGPDRSAPRDRGPQRNHPPCQPQRQSRVGAAERQRWASAPPLAEDLVAVTPVSSS